MSNRKVAFGASICFFVAVALVPLLHGHGETYVGPPGPYVDPPAPPEPAPTPPSTPNGHPTVPGKPNTNPGTGAPGTGRAGITPSGGASARRATTGGEAFDRWEFWWEANESSWFIPSPYRDDVVTPSDRKEPRARAASPAEWRTLALPRLLTLLGAKEADVADAAALALGHVVRPEEANLALSPLRRALDHDALSVRESATIALGVVGSSDALPTLRALLLDTDAGRALTSHPNGVEQRVRAFAAAAIGLVGERASFADLRAVLDDPRLVRHVELQQLALLALGMLHEDAAEVVPYVVELMARPWLDRLVLAQAPIALVRLAVSDSGRSAASATLPRLLALLRERTTERELRRSTVIALGRLGTTDDSEVIEALGEVVARSDDSIARHFALIALGEIANSDAAPAQHAEAQTRVELLLERELESPRRSEHRAFAALALGIRARNAALAPPARERTTTWLLELFESSRSPSHRAALALALGLARESRAAAPIAAAFEGSKDAAHQGYLALAIGMLNAREQAPSLLRQLAASRLDPVLEVRLARALAQLAPKAAAEALVARLRAADTTNETSLTALALAQTGEAIALAPLVELAADESLPSARRGVAAESLGVLHSSSAPSWKSVFEADTNYLTRTPSLNQLVMLF